MNTLTMRVSRTCLLDSLGLFKVTKANIIEARCETPILSCVLLAFSADKLTVMGTDLDMGLAIEIPAAAPDRVWRIALPVIPLTAALKNSKAESVEFEDVGGAVLIRMDGASMRLPYLPGADFPDGPACFGQPEGERFTFDAAGLASDLALVARCVSTEETRYYLNGVFLHARDGEFRMAATDGHRLAQLRRPAPENMDEGQPDAILPRRAVEFLIRALAKHRGDAKLSYTATNWAVQWGRCRLAGKLIDGTFPDYNRVIPSDIERVLTVDADTMAAAITQATAHTSGTGKNRAVRLDLGSDLTASATCPDNGTVSVDFSGGYDSDDFVVGLNASYARDCLAAFKGKSVRFGFGADAGAPIRMESDDVPGLLMVLMPLRLGEDKADLERTPVTDFTEQAPELVAALERTPFNPGRQAYLRDLGRLVRGAIDFLAAQGDTEPRAYFRACILMLLARMRGDSDAQALWGAHCNLYVQAPRGSFAAMVEAERKYSVSPPPVTAARREFIEMPGAGSRTAKRYVLYEDGASVGEASSRVAAERWAKGPAPSPAQPDNPAPMPAPGEAGPVPEPEPADVCVAGPPRYRNLQAFKAAAAIGSRWSLHRSANSEWLRDVTVTAACARGVEFDDGSTLRYPKQDGWRSDAAGLIVRGVHYSPARAVEAPVAVSAPSGDVSALTEAVAALTATVEALRDPGRAGEATGSEMDLERWKRRAMRLAFLADARRAQVRQLKHDLQSARALVAREATQPLRAVGN